MGEIICSRHPDNGFLPVGWVLKGLSLWTDWVEEGDLALLRRKAPFVKLIHFSPNFIDVEVQEDNQPNILLVIMVAQSKIAGVMLGI